MNGMDDAHEVHIHHTLEQRGIGFEERRGFGGAGIRDENVDGLARCGFGDRRLHRRLIGHIGSERMMRIACSDHLVQHGAIAAHDGDGRAGLHQRRRYGAADAAAAAGDQSVGGTGQGHGRPSSLDAPAGYILNFKLLQESALLA